MGGAFAPRRLRTPRATGEDELSRLLMGAVQRSFPAGGGIGDLVGALSFPQFGGPFAAPLTDVQQQAAGLFGPALTAGLSTAGQATQDVLGGLAGLGGADFLPPELRAIFGLGGGTPFGGLPGQDVLGELATGREFGQAGLSPLLAQSPAAEARGLLGGLAGQAPTGGAQDILSLLTGQAPTALAQARLFGGPGTAALGDIAGGGGFAQLANIIRQGSEAATQRQLRDVREQFSASGLLRSSPAIAAQLQAGQEAESGLNALLGQLGLQGQGQQIAAAQTLGQQAGLAGQLGLGQRGQTADIASILGQLGLAQRGQSADIARGLGELGLAERGQSADILGQLIGANLGAGQLGLGAAGQQAQTALGQAGLFGDLFRGGQQTQLSALLGLGQLTPSLAGLPLSLAGQGFGLGEALRGVQDIPLLRQLQEFQRTQGALVNPLLGFFGAAPQITGPGIGTQFLQAGAQGAGLAAAAK